MGMPVWEMFDVWWCKKIVGGFRFRSTGSARRSLIPEAALVFKRICGGKCANSPSYEMNWNTLSDVMREVM